MKNVSFIKMGSNISIHASREPGMVVLIGLNGERVGLVVKTRAPEKIIVKDYLIKKLAPLIDNPEIVNKNKRLNELILLSLSSKRENKETPLKTYLLCLDRLCEYDLELCASILGGTALELPSSEFLPLTRIIVN